MSGLIETSLADVTVACNNVIMNIMEIFSYLTKAESMHVLY